MSGLLLMCAIAGRTTAIPALRVVSVIELEAITPIPRAPEHVLGLTALRSQVLTVIDCSRALGLPPTDVTASSRAAVVRHDDHAYALLLDEARDVEESLSAPTPLPGGFGDAWHRVAQGLVETPSGPALLISVEKLIEGSFAEAA